MTAYPETCLVDYQDGDRTVITIEDASDSETESDAVARLTIDVNGGKIQHRVGLSPEACRALVERLRRFAK